MNRLYVLTVSTLPELQGLDQREPDEAWRPSGLSATARSPSSRPANVRRSWPVCRSQSLRVRSYEPERAWRPSGDIATAITLALVARERVQEPAGLQVPEPQRAIARAREGLAAVGTHRHRAHRAFVSVGDR